MEHMLTSATGSYWKSMRAVLTPTFSSGKIKGMFRMVQEKAKGLVKYCESNCKSGKPIEFVTTFRKLSLDVIGTCAFGMEIDSLNGSNEDFVEAAKNSSKITFIKIVKILLFLVTPWITKFFNIKFVDEHKEFLIQCLKENVEKRRSGIKRGDFVDLLLEAQESRENDTEDDKSKFSKLFNVVKSNLDLNFLFLYF